MYNRRNGKFKGEMGGGMKGAEQLQGRIQMEPDECGVIEEAANLDTLFLSSERSGAIKIAVRLIDGEGLIRMRVEFEKLLHC